MAYAAAGLAPLAYAAGFTLWIYKTTDAAATVDTANYFNNAADMLRVGDVILRVTYGEAAHTSVAGTSAVGFHYVNSISAGAVDVTDATAIGTADTD